MAADPLHRARWCHLLNSRTEPPADLVHIALHSAECRRERSGVDYYVCLSVHAPRPCCPLFGRLQNSPPIARLSSARSCADISQTHVKPRTIAVATHQYNTRSASACGISAPPEANTAPITNNPKFCRIVRAEPGSVHHVRACTIEQLKVLRKVHAIAAPSRPQCPIIT